MAEHHWSFKKFSLRRTNTESNLGSKKIKPWKTRSISDVRDIRDVRDDVSAVGDPGGIPSSPGTPPSSPPVSQHHPPTSRRKKIWNSFRSRTRRLRGKSRDKESSCESPVGDAGSGIPDEEGTNIQQDQTPFGATTRSSSFKKWRSDTMRTASTSDSPTTVDAPGGQEDLEDLNPAAPPMGEQAGGVEGQGMEEGSGLDNEDEVDSGIALVESSSILQHGENRQVSSPFDQAGVESAVSTPQPPVPPDHIFPKIRLSLLDHEAAEIFFNEQSSTSSVSFKDDVPTPQTVEPALPALPALPASKVARTKVNTKVVQAMGKLKVAGNKFRSKLLDTPTSGGAKTKTNASAALTESSYTSLNKKPPVSPLLSVPSRQKIEQADSKSIATMDSCTSGKISEPASPPPSLILHSNRSVESAGDWEIEDLVVFDGKPSDCSMGNVESLLSYPMGTNLEYIQPEPESVHRSKSKDYVPAAMESASATAFGAGSWHTDNPPAPPAAKPSKQLWFATKLQVIKRFLRRRRQAYGEDDESRRSSKKGYWRDGCSQVLATTKGQIVRLKQWHKRKRFSERWKKMRSIRVVRSSAGYIPFKLVHSSTPSGLLHEQFFSLYNLTGSSQPDVQSNPEDSSIEDGFDTCVSSPEDTFGLADNSMDSVGTGPIFLGSEENDEDDSSKEVSSYHLEDTDSSFEDQEGVLRQRQHVLMEHPFFLLDIRLQEGRDLVVRDSCGTSDPYVKFKIGSKQVYKSRIIFKNLNPKWEENFTIPVEDVQKPLQLKVFDYDRGLHDDPMGNAEVDLSQLELGKENELKLLLSDRGKPDYMGYILLTCTLLPKTQEDKEQYLHRSVRSPDVSGKKLKMQTWSGVVTIVLVEGIDLVPMDDNGLSDPYVKFKLANEKYRSKHKSKTLNPRWLEQFDLRMYNEQASQLEITVYDHDVRGRDDFMGRATIDISNLESERTHYLDVELEDGAGLLKVLLTISGTCGTDAQSDLSNYTPDSRQQGQLVRKYSFLRLSDFTDVGHLQIKVFKACGLKSADIGGNSDPFCVLELVNARVQTHTEYKTLNPEWNKVFSFKVRDIHSVLEVTIFDEDRDKKVEFLGKVAIPLLRIRSGERRWYALKDKKLNHRTKGAILLELDLIFNHVKAAIRTVNPTEDKFMQVDPKFKIHLMKKNIERVGQLISTIMEGGKFLQSCFSWESTPRSATAFVVFLVMVWNFEIYMLPITLLLIFLKNLLIAQIVGAFKREQVEDEYFIEEDDEEDEEKEKEEKKTFKEKLQSIQDVCLQVQQGMDMVACVGERIKNTFNWTVPWLSTLAVVALSAAVIVLYFIPLRWLILAWGINKFTKKLRKPNAVNNNELLDFLSRVPSDRELAQYREFRPELSPATGKKKRS